MEQIKNKEEKLKTKYYRNLAKTLTKTVCFIRAIATALFALLLLSKLLVLATACSAGIALFAILPFAILMACATFSLYVDPLNKRIFRLLNSKDLNSLLKGNNVFYLDNPKDGIFDKYKKAYFFLCHKLEIELQSDTDLCLSNNQKKWNSVVFVASILASLLESGIMFYSCFNVMNTIFKLMLPSIATNLLPLAICFAAICGIGAFITFYGVTAVAIRKKFRYNHPINSLTDKETLTMKIIQLREKLDIKVRQYFEERILNTNKNLSKFMENIKDSVKLKVIFELQNKPQEAEIEADKLETFISSSVKDLAVKERSLAMQELIIPKNISQTKLATPKKNKRLQNSTNRLFF